MPNHKISISKLRRMLPPTLYPPGMTKEAKQTHKNRRAIRLFHVVRNQLLVGKKMKRVFNVLNQVKNSMASRKIQGGMRKALRHKRIHNMGIPAEKRV